MDALMVTCIRKNIRERQAVLERAGREWADIFRSNDGARYAWDGIADLDEDLLILESSEGRLLGALSFCTRYGDERNIYISRIGVVLEHRGYGKRLMQKVSEIAADREQGVVALPTVEGRRLFRGIGMHLRPGGNPYEPEYAFTPDEAKRFGENQL
jgi:GNAT superfamily N-acetyltransferase